MFNSTSRNIFSASSVASDAIWIIVSLILAIVGGFIVYFLFLSKKNEGRFTGFLGWLYDFLSFKKMTLEIILKVTYLMCAIFATLSPLAGIGDNFLGTIVSIVVSNIFIRLIYEFSLILLVICRNTTEINKKLSDKDK